MPSILDGKVYLTAGSDEVTANVRDLVDRAPFVDSRGRIYTATRQSAAVAVDGATGEIVNVIYHV